MNHASIHNEIVQWSLDVQKLSKVFISLLESNIKTNQKKLNPTNFKNMA